MNNNKRFTKEDFLDGFWFCVMIISLYLAFLG